LTLRYIKMGKVVKKTKLDSSNAARKKAPGRMFAKATDFLSGFFNSSKERFNNSFIGQRMSVYFIKNDDAKKSADTSVSKDNVQQLTDAVKAFSPQLQNTVLSYMQAQRQAAATDTNQSRPRRSKANYKPGAYKF